MYFTSNFHTCLIAIFTIAAIEIEKVVESYKKIKEKV